MSIYVNCPHCISYDGNDPRTHAPTCFYYHRKMQQFTTGATRSAEGDKLDFEGFLSPFVLERYAKYLHEHRTQADGKQRSSDNWQGGMPRRRYLKSALRHLVEVWKAMRTVGWKDVDKGRDKMLQDAICAVMFNMMGLLYEILRGSDIDG